MGIGVSRIAQVPKLYVFDDVHVWMPRSVAVGKDNTREENENKQSPADVGQDENVIGDRTTWAFD